MGTILASGSAIRSALLQAAGLRFDVKPADLDESSLIQAQRAAGKTSGEVAIELSRAKACAVSEACPTDLVIGADQVLDFQGTLYQKPRSLTEADTHLRQLRGQTHRLISGVAVAKAGEVIWTHAADVELTMRAFSDAFLQEYLNQNGDDLLTTVGCYKLEGAGVTLFSEIKGDYFAILGLPMLPLLAFIRDQGEMPK